MDDNGLDCPEDEDEFDDQVIKRLLVLFSGRGFGAIVKDGQGAGGKALGTVQPGLEV